MHGSSLAGRLILGLAAAAWQAEQTGRVQALPAGGACLVHLHACHGSQRRQGDGLQRVVPRRHAP